jgi:hypothetical protein
MSNPFPFDDTFIQKVRRTCINATPKDTGNLAYNALRVYKKTTGFTVMYKATAAGYGSILNDFRLLRGATQGLPNPHYLWFDSGVHNNVLGLLITEFGGKNKTKPETKIEPTSRTFEGSAQYKYRATNDGTIQQINTANEMNQIDRSRDWSSRYQQYKNHNVKGWGI